MCPWGAVIVGDARANSQREGGRVVEEFVSLTVLSAPGESRPDFATRLSHLWTHMLRNNKADFEKVYAEKTAFETREDRHGRQYLVRAEILPLLLGELAKVELEHEPVDLDDTYSKYEAVAPEWMQIEH